MTCAREKCPLTQTILISTRSAASLVAITREISERSKRFLCSLLMLPLAHRAGRAGPICSSCRRNSGEGWKTEGAAEIALPLLLPLASPAIFLPNVAPVQRRPSGCPDQRPHAFAGPDEL